jgi:hypothetical protein
MDTELGLPVAQVKGIGMSNIVNFDLNAIDFESAVDEIDILVPKYLESLEMLGSTEDFEEIQRRLQNVVAYWERLALVFSQIEPLEDDIPFKEIIRDSLQSELATLEQAYLKVNLRIEFSENQWTKSMWKAAKAVLHRMDEVLEKLGFPEEHQDRQLIDEIQVRNQVKCQTWLLRSRH